MSSSAVGFENAVEQRTPVDLEVHGTIPPWLNGVLYRTGPGTTRIPTSADPNKSYDIQHWFDGLTMNHRFEIFPGGQRVSYCSRKGAEDLEKHISQEGKHPLVSFGQKADPCQSIFRKFFTIFSTLSSEYTGKASPSSSNIGVTLTPDMPGWNVAVADLPKQTSGPQFIAVKTDTNNLQLIDPCTLEPLKLAVYKDIDPRLDGQLSAAHSCRDKETGDFFNYSCKFGGPYPTYKIFKIGKDGATTILATVNDAPASYIHSFAMTENYIILCVWQAHLKQLSFPHFVCKLFFSTAF
jgi:torulene dioxygenase